MRKIKALAIFNAFSLLAQLSVAYLTGLKLLNRKDVGEISAKYESLFTPAPMTFAIWGIVYTALGLFCLYHIVIAYKHDKSHVANNGLLLINGLFIMVNLAGAAWLIAWTQEQLLVSVGLIFLQLFCLVLIHQRLGIYDPLKPSALKMTLQFPLSIYLGWISIAVIANTSSWLTAKNWDGFGLSAIQWTIMMISIAVILSSVMILIRRNIYFGLAVAWGLYGIIIKREGADPVLYTPVIIAAWVAIGIILLFSLFQLTKNISLKKTT